MRASVPAKCTHMAWKIRLLELSIETHTQTENRGTYGTIVGISIIIIGPMVKGHECNQGEDIRQDGEKSGKELATSFNTPMVSYN